MIVFSIHVTAEGNLSTSLSLYISSLNLIHCATLGNLCLGKDSCVILVLDVDPDANFLLLPLSR